jgi:xylulose-5-phosphate/fructose-6-phosphate phosphoketolase
MSRHDLAADAVRRAGRGDRLADALLAERDELRAAGHRDGVDPAEITDWRWDA